MTNLVDWADVKAFVWVAKRRCLLLRLNREDFWRFFDWHYSSEMSDYADALRAGEEELEKMRSALEAANQIIEEARKCLRYFDEEIPEHVWQELASSLEMP